MRIEGRDRTIVHAVYHVRYPIAAVRVLTTGKGESASRREMPRSTRVNMLQKESSATGGRRCEEGGDVLPGGVLRRLFAQIACLGLRGQHLDDALTVTGVKFECKRTWCRKLVANLANIQGDSIGFVVTTAKVRGRKALSLDSPGQYKAQRISEVGLHHL